MKEQLSTAVPVPLMGSYLYGEAGDAHIGFRVTQARVMGVRP